MLLNPRPFLRRSALRDAPFGRSSGWRCGRNRDFSFRYCWAWPGNPSFENDGCAGQAHAWQLLRLRRGVAALEGWSGTC